MLKLLLTKFLPYNLRSADLSGDMNSINSQTGLVNWSVENDNAGPALDNTNFTKLTSFTNTPGAGEAAIVDSNYTVITLDNQRTSRSSTIYFGSNQSSRFKSIW